MSKVISVIFECEKCREIHVRDSRNDKPSSCYKCQCTKFDVREIKE
jgi:hypothetical protein